MLFWILLAFFVIFGLCWCKKILEVQRSKQQRKLSDVFCSFRTSIALVLEYSEVLGSYEYNEDKQIELLEIIQTETEKVLHIIDKMLAQSTSEENCEDSMVDCGKVLTYVSKSLNFFAKKKNIEINLDLEKNLFADMYEIKFWRIVSSIMANAIEYNVNNVKINVKAYGEDDFVVIVIQDTGVGIEPENISNVFKTGFYKKSKGFGFSIVRKNIEKYGGKIKLESQVGVGSEFIVSVPRKF